MNSSSLHAEVRTGKISLEPDGVVHIDVYPKVEMELRDAQESIEALRSICKSGKRPILVDISKIRTISREARLHYAGPEAEQVQTAVALVIKSPVSTAIGNFFMGMNKPAIPTRLFTSKVEALTWLKTFL